VSFEASQLYQQFEPDKYRIGATAKAAEDLLGEVKENENEPATLEEAREIFGDDFVGIDELIANGMGFAKPDKLRSFAQKKWSEKVAQLKLTPERLRELAEEGFMLIFRSDSSANSTHPRQRLTPKSMTLRQDLPDCIDPDEEIVAGWGLVAKEPLPVSLNLTYDEQQRVLEDWATDHGFDPAEVRRRTPAEVIYDVLCGPGNPLDTAGEQILGKKDPAWPVSIARTAAGAKAFSIFDPGPLFKSATSGVCPNL
jgi:hypothetical protein